MRFAATDVPEEVCREMAELDRSLVAGLPVFSAFAPPELDRILGEARLQRVAKNATVFEEGAEAFVLRPAAWTRAGRQSDAGRRRLNIGPSPSRGPSGVTGNYSDFA